MKKKLATAALAAAGSVALAAPSLADTFAGTNDDDRIVGTPRHDEIRGLAGDDMLLGRGGDDFIRGNRGNDHVRGEGGNDFLHGDKGDDTVRGGGRGDDVMGENGSDVIAGGAGPDSVSEYSAPGFFDSPNDPDLLYGARGEDHLTPLDGRDEVFAGSRHDVIRLQRDGFRDVLRCGTGNDLVVYFSPRDGRDVLIGCERVVVH
jgi:Ca2+-binding RTX toxin-like protein